MGGWAGRRPYTDRVSSRVHRRRRRVVLLSACAGVCVCAGSVSCAVKRGPAASAAEAGAPRDPLGAASVAVHPLTHLVRGGAGGTRVELHLELRDRWDHPTKDLGVFLVELIEGGGPLDAGEAGPRQRQSWRVDLRDAAANAAPFDRVTRTYRLTLVDLPDELASSDRLRLGVRFTSTDGRQLTTTHRFGVGP